MPSSSLAEVKVEVGVEVEVEVEVEAGVVFEVDVGVLRCNLDLSLVVVPTYTGGWVVGWLGGWLEDWRVMLNSTQDQIKLKLKFELSLAKTHISIIASTPGDASGDKSVAKYSEMSAILGLVGE